MAKESHFGLYWKNYAIAILVVLFMGNLMLGGLVNSSRMTYNSMDTGSYAQESLAKGIAYYDGGFAPDVETRQIIRNADLSIETSDYDVTKILVGDLFKSYDVIVLSQNENKYKNDYRMNDYRVKIDSSKLDVFLDEVKTYGEVMYINVYTNDVTGTYVDYTDRIERYKEQIAKYELMLTKDNVSVKEEVEVQNRINEIENQLAYLEKSKSNVEESVAYSEVSLHIKEKQSVWSEVDFLGFKDGFALFIDSLQNGIKFILIVIGFVLPFGVVYGIYRLFSRKRKN